MNENWKFIPEARLREEITSTESLIRKKEEELLRLERLRERIFWELEGRGLSLPAKRQTIIESLRVVYGLEGASPGESSAERRAGNKKLHAALGWLEATATLHDTDVSLNRQR